MSRVLLFLFQIGCNIACYKDYRDDKHKTLHLEGAEFVRRYLMHILPKGFTRIRHYGFLSNRCRVCKLAVIREALAMQETGQSKQQVNDEEHGMRCPVCKAGRLRLVAIVPADIRRVRREPRRR